MANRVTIKIAGQHYTMLAEETVEYMNEVAEMAQQTIAACGGSASFASTRALALASDSGNFLATIQVAITLVGFAASAAARARGGAVGRGRGLYGLRHIQRAPERAGLFAR